MDITQLSPNLFVGAQIAKEDLEILAGDGFTDVVCNRPDTEHTQVAGSQTMAGVAAELGLAFHYLPIVPGEPFLTQAQKLGRLTSRPGTMVFAYCRSGARSARSWELAQAELAGIERRTS